MLPLCASQGYEGASLFLTMMLKKFFKVVYEFFNKYETSFLKIIFMYFVR